MIAFNSKHYFKKNIGYSMDLLCVEQLVKTFSAQKTWWGALRSPALTAVRGISFSVKEGEIVGLLGANGAGKTTTIQMLLSTLIPTSGSITYFGKNFFTHRSAVLQKVGFASTYARLPSRLTVLENMHLYGRLYGLTHAQRIETSKYYLEYFDLWELRDQQTGSLSEGQKIGVMLAKAFLSRPKIVLLDEPTASLDPDIGQTVRAFVMEQQKDHGVSFLFTSHNMSEVNEVCSRVLVMKQGLIIANNTPQQLAVSVSKVRISLMICEGLENLIKHVQDKGFVFTMNTGFIEIEVEEQLVASFLQTLAGLGIRYSEIGIKKPTLEDYFLQVAKKDRRG